MTEAAAIACLQKAAEAETMRGLATRLGISAGHLCHVLKGRKDPSAVLLRFGFERAVSYRRVAAFPYSNAPAVRSEAKSAA